MTREQRLLGYLRDTYCGGVAAELARIESTMATKADVGDIRVEMHKAFTDQTWKLIIWMTGICTGLLAITFWIAKTVH